MSCSSNQVSAFVPSSLPHCPAFPVLHWHCMTSEEASPCSSTRPLRCVGSSSAHRQQEHAPHTASQLPRWDTGALPAVAARLSRVSQDLWVSSALPFHSLRRCSRRAFFLSIQPRLDYGGDDVVQGQGLVRGTRGLHPGPTRSFSALVMPAGPHACAMQSPFSVQLCKT